MPTTLFTLLRLHYTGKLRHSLRGFRTPRGLFFLILGTLVLALWLGPALYRAMKMPHADVQLVQTVAPFAILGFCLSNLFASFGEKAIAFSGAEMDFLFPGPFSRRSLLFYKIGKTAVGTAFTTLVFSVLLLRFSVSWIACCIGVWLTVQFMQLFAIAVTLTAQTVGERAYTGARRAVLAIAAVLGIVAILPALIAHLHSEPTQIMKQIHATVAGRILLAPFEVFARTITARPGELILWAGLALAINAAMLAAIIALDANYVEAAAMISERRFERRQSSRSGGIARWAAGKVPRFKIAELPWIGGAGPIAWRQLVGAARSTKALFILLLLIGIVPGTFVIYHRAGSAPSMQRILGTVAWMNLVFISMLKFDFRDELDRLDLLRSLPIRPSAIAAAELFTPVLVITAMQAVLLMAALIFFKHTWQFVWVAALFALPFNIVHAAIENLLFMMFPLRAAGLIAGDMQLFGRQMVVSVCKFLLLLALLGACAVVGTLGYLLGRQSWPTFAVFAWVALSLAAVATIPVLARTFARFDPSIDTPP